MERVIPAELIQYFEKIYVDEKSVDSNIAQRIFKYFPPAQIEIVKEQPWSDLKGSLSAREFDRSKKNIFVTPFAGTFFKRCPGASQKTTLTCCNYYVLNLGSQCNMNCSYCYLQSYLNTPVMKIYSNIDQALQELEVMAQDHGQLPYRVGTGEIIDSLSLDELTLYSRALIEFFGKYPRWTLEFKTKSDRVDQFLDLGPAANVVVSWSMNAAHIIESEEHGTARLEQRMAAAQKCVRAGLPVAFHIDPIIWYPEWKTGYSNLVKEITTQFEPDQVHVISMGSLRFQPEQRHMMRERFGYKSYVTQAEMFPSEGNKLRYDSSLRKEMFDFILDEFRRHSKSWKIFLCMETPETWISTFEKSKPLEVEGLRDFFRPLPKLGSGTNLALVTNSLNDRS